MTLHRRNPRRDEAEPEICAYLDALGIPYWQLSGAGVPDLLLLHKGLWKLIEVKDRLGRLTGPQLTFFEKSRDCGAKHLHIVRDFDSLKEALEA